MTAKQKFTPEQVEMALRATAGVYTLAAAWLESKTGRSCSTNTVSNYIKRYPKLAAAEEAILHQNLDLAETELLKAIRGGNMTAIIFYLKTKGKQRGYTERQEITTPDGVAIGIVRVPQKVKDADAWAEQYKPR